MQEESGIGNHRKEQDECSRREEKEEGSMGNVQDKSIRGTYKIKVAG